MTDKALMKLAKQAYKKAYSPYSNVKVGAAILCVNGKVFTGCNIENASYGLTVCAERTAVLKAVSSGQTRFVKIAIASDQKREFSPCGACRQVLSEFNHDIAVIWQDADGKIKTQTLSHLLPFAFKKFDRNNIAVA